MGIPITPAFHHSTTPFSLLLYRLAGRKARCQVLDDLLGFVGKNLRPAADHVIDRPLPVLGGFSRYDGFLQIVTGAAKLHGDLFSFAVGHEALPMIVRPRDCDGK